MKVIHILFAFLFLTLFSCGEEKSTQQASPQAIAGPPAHEQQWSVFLRERTSGPAVITLDLGWRQQAPLPDYPRLFQATVLAEERLPSGFPTQVEVDSANQLQEALMTRMGSSGNGIFVGSVSETGQKTLYFYLRARPEADEIARQTVEQFTARQVEASIEPEKDWSTYLQLYPSEREMMEIRNDGVLLQLQKAGDDLLAPRPIEHYSFFPSSTARQGFSESLQAIGFEILNAPNTPSEDGSYMLHYIRTDSIQAPQIHELTWELVQLTEAAGGTYDGWETVVVRKRTK